FEHGRWGVRGFEDDVAAGDEGLDVGEAELGKEAAQVDHLHGAAADVDGAEEGNQPWHVVYERRRCPPRLSRRRAGTARRGRRRAGDVLRGRRPRGRTARGYAAGPERR